MFSKLRFKIWVWFEGIRYAISEAVKRMQPCHKEQLGYTCRHRVYPDGSRECGK